MLSLSPSPRDGASLSRWRKSLALSPGWCKSFMLRQKTAPFCARARAAVCWLRARYCGLQALLRPSPALDRRTPRVSLSLSLMSKSDTVDVAPLLRVPLFSPPPPFTLATQLSSPPAHLASCIFVPRGMPALLPGVGALVRSSALDLSGLGREERRDSGCAALLTANSVLVLSTRVTVRCCCGVIGLVRAPTICHRARCA